MYYISEYTSTFYTNKKNSRNRLLFTCSTWIASPHWSRSYSDEMRNVCTDPALLDILKGRFGEASTNWASSSANFFRCFSFLARLRRPPWSTESVIRIILHYLPICSTAKRIMTPHVQMTSKTIPQDMDNVSLIMYIEVISFLKHDFWR